MSTWTPIDPLPQAITANEQRVKEMLDEGKTMFQIAYKLHISSEQTREIIFEIHKKEAISMARKSLSEEQRAEVVKMYESGASMRDISVKYFVSKSTVANILLSRIFSTQQKWRRSTRICLARSDSSSTKPS